VEEIVEECFVQDMSGKLALDVVHEGVNVLQDGGEDEVSLAESVIVRGEPGILLKIRRLCETLKQRTDFEEERDDGLVWALIVVASEPGL